MQGTQCSAFGYEIQASEGVFVFWIELGSASKVDVASSERVRSSGALVGARWYIISGEGHQRMPSLTLFLLDNAVPECRVHK